MTSLYIYDATFSSESLKIIPGKMDNRYNEMIVF